MFQNILEMELPRPKALLSHHGYDMGGQGAVAGEHFALFRGLEVATLTFSHLLRVWACLHLVFDFTKRSCL